ncbi:ImuA family protein [Sphingomonas pruni]|uniref:ImuA family protein n=1 Tax=Sphingomonas pruni TaxID=40683 RepID=UPI0008329122|nr:protein ImuA [Sphingomonas pruni]
METAACLDPIADLRRRIAALDAPARVGGVVAFGVEAIDHRLADKGLAVGGLHEVAAAAPSLAEDAATTLFLAGIAARAAPLAPVLWALTRFDLYAPGLEQAGLSPDRLVFAQARDERELLAVMEDALRHGGLSAVVGETRRVDMTASRRLQLAAADGKTPALLLRRRKKLGACPLGEPSAATTRWRIGCASSAPLGIAGVGRSRWFVELVRQRNGNPFSLVVEGCDAQGRLGLPAPSADRAVGAGDQARAA